MRSGDFFILIPILGVVVAAAIYGWMVIAAVIFWAVTYGGCCFLMDWFVNRRK